MKDEEEAKTENIKFETCQKCRLKYFIWSRSRKFRNKFFVFHFPLFIFSLLFSIIFFVLLSAYNLMNSQREDFSVQSDTK